MAEIVKVNSSSPEPAVIARAAELVRQGQVVAIPTDTFYGLAASPFDLSAVDRIFSIKGRAKMNPLLLLVDSIEMAVELSADLPPQFFSLAKRFWPGPLTMVVRASRNIPASVTANTGTIGLRLPAAAIPVALVRSAGCPVTATSANLTGQRNASTAQEVESYFGKLLPLILDGGISRTENASTVLNLSGEKWDILREGEISRGEIETFFDTAPSPGRHQPE